MSNFVHLHNHTDVSTRDSACSISKTIKKVKEMGFSSYAITDHGTIAGWVPFNIECKKQNIKGIYGVEAYEAERRTFNKESSIDKKRYHSVFIARNKKGIQFLKKLVTFSMKKENTYYKPRYDLEFLKLNKNEIYGNIIWMSACIQGRLPRLLLQGEEEKAKEYFQTMQNIFGKENVFVELQNHGIPEEKEAIYKLINFAKNNEYQMVATNDIHYINKENYIAREILIARDIGQTIRERELLGQILPPELYIKSENEMRELFKEVPEAIENTIKITNMCENIDLEEKNWHFPHFDIPKGYTEDSYMAKLAKENFPKKYPKNNLLNIEKEKEFKERLQFELDTIANMNTSAYMLIDSDFIVWAKENNIMVGPGRGSACGSMAAYCLGITDVDPMPYELYFERFMNPERITMPDIDTDFQDDRRMEVVEYVVNKYGADKVAQILTFGTIGARMAIRDVGAVFDIDAKLVDKIAKMIPMQPGITIDKSFDLNPQLKNLYETNNNVKELIDNSKTVEGLIRQTGVHAAGILISDKPLVEYGALMEVEDSDIPVFLGDMKAVEYLKLLKMDFLGLKTLTVIKDTLELIKKDTGKEININSLTLNDPEVFRYISKGDTAGVFQLEQSGMQQFMKNLQPTSLEDVIAGISMYRPGPMDQIPKFLENKKNPDKIQYYKDAAPFLSPILDVTYGVMIYQEQVMQIVRDLAGYTFGRSDLVRRAMAKKKENILLDERYVFIYGEVVCPECNGTGKQANGDNCVLCEGKGKVATKKPCPYCKGKDKKCIHCNGSGVVESKGERTVEGCVKRGISEQTAHKIFDEMIDFAKYAFNKSHATAYAILAYQTAFLKNYYPRQYMTAYLNSIISNQDKVRKYIGIVKKMGINIIKPDINTCESHFIEDEKGIYMGLSSLKFVGKNIQEVIQERKSNGLFRDLQDLLTRVGLNRRELESLIKSGALDCFNHKRSQMINSLDILLTGSKKERQAKQVGQTSIFDMLSEDDYDKYAKFEMEDIEEYPKLQKYKMEKEVSGFYLSGHPLELPEYERFAQRSNITSLDFFTEEDNQKHIKIIGIIQIEKKFGGIKISKSGKQYAVFQIEDKYSTIDVLAFEKCIQQCGHQIFNGNIVEIDGTLSVQTNEIEKTNANGEIEIEQITDVKIFANNISSLSSIDENKKIYIKIDKKTSSILPSIIQIAKQYPGKDQLFYFNESENKLYKYNGTIGYNEEFRHILNTFFDKQSIAVK